MLDKRTEIQRYKKEMSGGGMIKAMTVALIGMTVYFAYDLHNRRRFPHQHGADLRDLLPESYRKGK